MNQSSSNSWRVDSVALQPVGPSTISGANCNVALAVLLLAILVPLLPVAAETGDSLENENYLHPAMIEKLTGEPARDYMTYDFGREKDDSAVSVVVGEDRAIELVSLLREKLPDEAIVFVGTDRWLGDEDHGDKVEVVIAAGRNQYDILRLARTDAVNYGMLTEDLIAWFEESESEIKIDIVQASTDTIFGLVLEGPKDMDSFVEKLYEFCPDIVDQGAGNIDDLREMVGDYRSLYLWWD